MHAIFMFLAAEMETGTNSRKISRSRNTCCRFILKNLAVSAFCYIPCQWHVMSIVLNGEEVFLTPKMRSLVIEIGNIFKERKLALNINIHKC